MSFCYYGAMTCYDHALRLLANREHSQFELQQKLTKKGYSSQEIDDVLARLEEEGYQSDKRFCEVFLRSRLRKTPEGKSVLVMRLTAKGVDRSLATAAVEAYFSENEESINKIYKEYAEKLILFKGEAKANETLIKKGIRGYEQD